MPRIIVEIPQNKIDVETKKYIKKLEEERDKLLIENADIKYRSALLQEDINKFAEVRNLVEQLSIAMRIDKGCSNCDW
jgi:hypothetical protein